MNSEQTNQIAAALAKAQAAMENAKFNKVNPHFKSRYADLSAIIDAIKKPLSDNGISYTQTTYINEDTLVMVTKLMHTSGQYLESEYPLPLVPDKPQVLGSAMTYARRYELAAICGIAAEEDNDAEGVAERIGARKPPKPAADVIKTPPPPHDPQTGEVIPPKPIQFTSDIDVQDMAREAAMRGAAVIKEFYKRQTAEDQARINEIKAELDKLVDEFEKGYSGEGS